MASSHSSYDGNNILGLIAVNKAPMNTCTFEITQTAIFAGLNQNLMKLCVLHGSLYFNMYNADHIGFHMVMLTFTVFLALDVPPMRCGRKIITK